MAHQTGMQTARDIPLIITSAASSSERRITPSWTIAHLKTKLESVTGIPPASQKLLLRTPHQPERVLEAADEETVQVGQWQLVDYAEIHVCLLRGRLSFRLCSVARNFLLILIFNAGLSEREIKHHRVTIISERLTT